MVSSDCDWAGSPGAIATVAMLIQGIRYQSVGCLQVGPSIGVFQLTVSSGNNKRAALSLCIRLNVSHVMLVAEIDRFSVTARETRMWEGFCQGE